MARAVRHARWFTPLSVFLTILVAFGGVALADHPDDSGFLIDGTVPDNGAAPFADPSGNVKELGPLNESTTKLGVIHNDGLPTLGTSNPNGQVDLKNVWFDTSTVDGTDWLYFAWERDSTNGSGVIAIEFQQAAAPAACDYGTATTASLIANCNPWDNRQEDDFMLVWDQVGGAIQISIRVFDGTAFGAPVVLNAHEAKATLNGDTSRGEAVVDLATVFPSDPTDCFSIANVIPGTITGNSDQADYKDTVLADIADDIAISNCGTVTINKETIPDGATGSFNFNQDIEGTADFSLSDDGSKVFSDVLAGSYEVSEDVPSGWLLTSIVCTGGTTVNGTDDDVAITLAAGDDVECTFTNTRQTGAIEITKTRKHAADGAGNHAHEGVTFTITGGDLPTAGQTVVTDANGEACVDGLSLDTYTVTETVPAGYVSDDASEEVTVSVVADCDDTSGQATVAFANMPLTDLLVQVESQVEGGTVSSISCVDDADDSSIGSDGVPTLDDPVEVDADDLEPGTYVCTIVIDP
ncbi:MAG TPA: SpaA isopeptide-forming pilin-related protein [Acidimicrobiia bacterium]|jgi:hypothetical protein|nr:SpaA isopeptide-forming pilin-related protein [Acidimicrobiia bacterium]